jgi:hypothetical protein
LISSSMPLTAASFSSKVLVSSVLRPRFSASAFATMAFASSDSAARRFASSAS